MTRRAKLWLYGSLLFALLNAGGALFAARLGQDSHAAGHLVLLLLGVYVAWRVRRPRPGSETAQTRAAPLFDERLERIEQSLDAIAVEVERVGEGQRFVTKLGQQMKENSSP
jgi:hypothetical protein